MAHSPSPASRRIWAADRASAATSLELEPNFSLASANLGGAYYVLGEFEKGIADFAKAKELHYKPE